MKIPLKLLVPLAGAMFVLPFLINGLNASVDCKESERILTEMHLDQISLVNDSGKIVSFDSRIADSTRDRANGYQHICEELINESTILFVYSTPSRGKFHMNNVKAPLDIGFFDDKGKLFKTMVMDTYEDGNKKLYDPGRSFQYALEARAGFFADHKISERNSRLVVNSVNH